MLYYYYQAGDKGRRLEGVNMTTYMKQFNDENDAIQHATLKNRVRRAAGNLREWFAVVDGPSNDFAVVDGVTAIDLGMGYFIPD